MQKEVNKLVLLVPNCVHSKISSSYRKLSKSTKYQFTLCKLGILLPLENDCQANTVFLHLTPVSLLLRFKNCIKSINPALNLHNKTKRKHFVTYSLNISILHALIVEDSISSVTLSADWYVYFHTSVMYLMRCRGHSLLLVMYLHRLVYNSRLKYQHRRPL